MLTFVCLLDALILGFCYRNLTRETGVFELALTITLVCILKKKSSLRVSAHLCCFMWNLQLIEGLESFILQFGTRFQANTQSIQKQPLEVFRKKRFS